METTKTSHRMPNRAAPIIETSNPVRPREKNHPILVGSNTLALGLIILGTGTLAANLGMIALPSILVLWPALLIGLGVEYFVKALLSRREVVQFSIPSTIFIGLMAVTLIIANNLYNAIQHFPFEMIWR